jgi:hypothetical protein
MRQMNSLQLIQSSVICDAATLWSTAISTGHSFAGGCDWPFTASGTAMIRFRCAAVGAPRGMPFPQCAYNLVC